MKSKFMKKQSTQNENTSPDYIKTDDYEGHPEFLHECTHASCEEYYSDERELLRIG